MVRCLGYIRVSTQDQATEGYSLGHQQARIEEAVRSRGWDLVGTHKEEGVTGAHLDRPALTSVLDALREGDAEALMVARLDRLSRSLLDFAGLVERADREGWAIVALDLGVDTTTPAGQLLANVMASFAQFERDLIRERTTAGRIQKAQQGQGWVTGRPPYGYRLRGGTLEPHPDEAHVVQFIFRKSASGMMRTKVARLLNQEGVPAPQAERWTRQAVLRVVRRTTYRGDYQHEGHVLRVPPLVRKSQWRRAQVSWPDRKKEMKCRESQDDS